MSQIAIRANGLGKYYRLGQRVRYRTLRDTLTDAIRAPHSIDHRPQRANVGFGR
jgi:hypothetical protein